MPPQAPSRTVDTYFVIYYPWRVIYGLYLSKVSCVSSMFPCIHLWPSWLTSAEVWVFVCLHSILGCWCNIFGTRSRPSFKIYSPAQRTHKDSFCKFSSSFLHLIIVFHPKDCTLTGGAIPMHVQVDRVGRVVNRDPRAMDWSQQIFVPAREPARAHTKLSNNHSVIPFYKLSTTIHGSTRH